MRDLPFSSSEEIAGAAGLHERYVREWLGGMAAARIVEVTADGQRFRLPAAHAAHLTRASAADNLAVFSQYISVLGTVEDLIVESFRNGGGVGYEEYSRFHDIMAEDSGQSVLPALHTSILPLFPDLTSRLTAGIHVLDVGCGRGKALLSLACRYPGSQFTGYDFCLPPLREARKEATLLGLENITFVQQDLTYFEPTRTFDLITAFDAIHDQARPDAVLRAIYRALKPEGYFLMQDIDASSNVAQNLEHPLGPLLYTISTMHCMSVSLASGGLGLGTMWGTERALHMLANAGFQDVQIHRLPHDVQNCYYTLRK
ncbi:MAG: class I SAM-dependent methyltransferase [Cytophagales bacterium]|nr:class I SAM-dependent methyltransferase [Cytophagales bacterium]